MMFCWFFPGLGRDVVRGKVGKGCFWWWLVRRQNDHAAAALRRGCNTAAVALQNGQSGHDVILRFNSVAAKKQKSAKQKILPRTTQNTRANNRQDAKVKRFKMGRRGRRPYQTDAAPVKNPL
jgi:hypothetical protein